jgi:hypothetical protein
MDGVEIIKAFGEKLGIELELDNANSCSFQADEVIVTITALSEIDQIVISGDLGTPPAEQLEHLYKMMLEANHMYRSTFGATLSLNNENDHFALCKVIPCRALDNEIFYKEMESFISICDIWFKVIRNYRSMVTDFPGKKMEDNFNPSSFIPV